jgi:uncharacterized protein DUF6622
MPALFGTIVTVIVHTPLWVWPLYVLLLFLGVQRTRDSAVALWRVLPLPLVVTLLAIVSLIVAGLGALPAILAGLVIGGAIGWQLEPRGDTHRLPDSKIWLRGEWWTFALIVVILVFRYAINVAPVLNPALYPDPVWHFGTLFLSAALSGVFLGRTAVRLRVYFRAVPAIP